MRVRLLVVVLMLLTLSTESLQASTLQTPGPDGNLATTEILLASETEGAKYSSQMRPVGHRPDSSVHHELQMPLGAGNDDYFREPQAIVGVDDRVRVSPAVLEVA